MHTTERGTPGIPLGLTAAAAFHVSQPCAHIGPSQPPALTQGVALAKQPAAEHLSEQDERAQVGHQRQPLLGAHRVKVVGQDDVLVATVWW